MAKLTDKQDFTQGEINTMRCALAEFRERMSREGALGNDECGEDIRKGYLLNARKLLNWVSYLG
ncbi:Uncharacterised protein [Yersinia frederiksenii]|nr:Uncharacterised protein [Yersinia frederiksenii]